MSNQTEQPCIVLFVTAYLVVAVEGSPESCQMPCVTFDFSHCVRLKHHEDELRTQFYVSCLPHHRSSTAPCGGDRIPKPGPWVQRGWAHTCQARCIQVTKKDIYVPSALSVVSKVSGYLKRHIPWGIVVVWDARGIALYVFFFYNCFSWNCAAPIAFIVCRILYYSYILHDGIHY
jgi:hypothetical protein